LENALGTKIKIALNLMLGKWLWARWKMWVEMAVRCKTLDKKSVQGLRLAIVSIKIK